MTLHDRTESEWDELLAAPSEPEPTIKLDAVLRRAILDRSTRAIRRRRRVRRFAWVAALAACYVAGLASAQFGRGSMGVTAGLPGNNNVRASAAGSAVASDPSKPANYVRIVREPVQEIAASRPACKPPSRFERLRRISDEYLYQRGDVTTAIHYYRKALAVATDAELAIATDTDSWLLIALKQERLQERNDENRST
ncbi:MAG: hypothetical protein JW719_07870 [Pirellulales bacterium]|nr:hypothetical protein [Pirellulales bacterium]